MTYENQFSWEIGSLPPGIYFLKGTMDGRSDFRKVVKL